MSVFSRLFALFNLIPFVFASASASDDRAALALKNTSAALGADLGLPCFIRIIKEDLILELWVRRAQGWVVKKSYPILAMSGKLGPKTKEGDLQAPEGFYGLVAGNLNPKSNYHLSFNIGYPNAYDRSLGRTGSFIMVHGSAYSIGCFAMGDPAIEEIYSMVAQALKKGQAVVPIQIYPFRMSSERMAKEQANPHVTFWRYLLTGWQFTEKNKAPYSSPSLQ